MEEIFLGCKTKEEKSIVIVRLTTSYWSDNSGIYCKKSVRYLRRKSTGFNYLEEDVSMVGADEVLTRIVNIDDCKDGVYEAIMINEKRDRETGVIDDYDYRLIEYKEK